MSTALERVRLGMESAEGTGFDLKTLRELAEDDDKRIDDALLEKLDLLEPAKRWAVLMASGIVPMVDYLDDRSAVHVHTVAEEAHAEIDSQRHDYWLSKENKAHDEEASWRLGLDAQSDEPVYLDTESYDDE